MDNIHHILQNKEPWVILTIGTPLTGKSSWIEKNFPDPENHNLSIICRDEILKELTHETDYGKAYKMANHKEVNRLLKSRILESSIMKENVIIDMTNLSSKRRKDILKPFEDEYYKVAVIFPFLTDEEYHNRNMKRSSSGPENKFISKEVFTKMKASYQKIEKEEGFNKILSL